MPSDESLNRNFMTRARTSRSIIISHVCSRDKTEKEASKSTWRGEIMPSKEYYNVTPEQREISLWRDAKRRELRELYLKDTGHPTKSLLFDTGIHRFAASKSSIEQFFVPTLVNYITRVGFVVGSIVFTALLIKKRKDAREHLYRTGQVSYRDRDFKFV